MVDDLENLPMIQTRRAVVASASVAVISMCMIPRNALFTDD